MKKQEFMAFSLPYGLKCKEVDLNVIFNFSTKIYDLMSILNWDNSYKPILRPLSDLIKPIEHNGETFVPMLKLVDLKNTEWDKMEAVEYYPFPRILNLNLWYKVQHVTLGEIITINPKNVLVLPLHLFLKLIKWHFDIANLIESGEAIDINTLTENPYK